MPFERTFFVTTVTWQRTPLFRNPQRAQVMMDVLEHYRDLNKYILHEFVIMPDHMHLLLTPAADISLERAMQFIKGGFSYRLGSSKKRLVWQESFTNHRVRDAQDFARHAEYIGMNPVRARLVETPALYPYSSVNLETAAVPGGVRVSGSKCWTYSTAGLKGDFRKASVRGSEEPLFHGDPVRVRRN